MTYHLEFEKPIVELEAKILELQNVDKGGNIKDEIARIREKADRILVQTYSKLAPEQKVQVARHPSRPHFVDYAKRLIQDFTPLAGDRLYGEDHALMGGLGLGVLAVFSIAGLLHTGQLLSFARATRFAVLLLVAAVALRVLPDLGLMPQPPGPPYAGAAFLWAASFLLWLKTHWPALSDPATLAARRC